MTLVLSSERLAETKGAGSSTSTPRRTKSRSVELVMVESVGQLVDDFDLIAGLLEQSS